MSNYQPAIVEITAATNSEQAQITTGSNHVYSTGDVVRIYIPAAYGMFVYALSKVTVINTTTLSTTIDTSRILPFVVPAAPYTNAQIIGVNGPVDNVA